MMKKDTKCVLVLDEEIPAGVLANTAAILGASLGQLAPEYIGQTLHK